MLQLEPTSLRQNDDLDADTHIDAKGAHLPAALHRIASNRDSTRVYSELSNRVTELVGAVREIRVDRDEGSRTLTLRTKESDGRLLPAASLSDGTLRFIALSVMELDPELTGLLCLEEPENGMHPERMQAIIDLLYDIAVDPELADGEDNPLRQVVITTHSPVVAARIDSGDLVFASQREALRGKTQTRSLTIRAVDDTWRIRSGTKPISKGRLLSYLSSLMPAGVVEKTDKPKVYQHVVNQMSLPFASPR